MLAGHLYCLGFICHLLVVVRWAWLDWGLSVCQSINTSCSCSIDSAGQLSFYTRFLPLLGFMFWCFRNIFWHRDVLLDADTHYSQCQTSSDDSCKSWESWHWSLQCCCSIICPDSEQPSMSIWTIMSKVRLEAFMWVSCCSYFVMY